MTLDANADAFIALLTQGLIDDAQHDAVRALPQAAALPPIPGPAHALAWMLMQGLLSDEALNATLEKMQAAVPEGADPPQSLDDAEETVYEAEDLVELAAQGITHEAVQALYDAGLIDLGARGSALDITPLTGTVPAAQAVTLAWLVTEGELDKDKFEATRKQVATEPAFAMAADRRRIVDEAAALIDADEKLMNGWKQRAQRQRSLGALKLLAFVAVLGGGLGWYLLTPAGVPACDAASTRKTLDSLMVRVAVEARMRTMSPEARSAIQTPSLGTLREVGFRKAERVRGCSAVLTQGDSKEPMAFTIGVRTPGSDDMIVRGADAAIVEARFGHLDAQGKPLYNADPVGREALEKAFREATDSLGLHRPSPQDAMLRGGAGFVNADPDRSREVAEIEPTGACRASADGHGQTRPLLIEYNDRLLSALGGGERAITLRGEFNFVQDNGVWRAGDGFTKTFAKALIDGRMKSLGVPDTAQPG